MTPKVGQPHESSESVALLSVIHSSDNDRRNYATDHDESGRITPVKQLSPDWIRPCACLTLGLMIVVVFLGMLLYDNPRVVWPLTSTPPLTTYDYIVIGGGPSGIITATKLAKAFPALSILLLESGTDSQTSVLRSLQPAKLHSVPSFWSSNTLWQDHDVSLNKFDVPLMWSGVASSQGRRDLLPLEETWSDHHWPIQRTLLGRTLGGCGLHNAMIYIRSLPEDFERWNVTGWTWETMLQHYMDLERYVPDHGRPVAFWPLPKHPLPHRGYHGPITTVKASSTSAVDAVAPLFVQSALHAGHRLAAEGFNEPTAATRLGAGYYEFNIRNGLRDSIAAALLGRQAIPDNLQVRTGWTVTRVLTAAHKATGVEYVQASTGRVGQVFLANRFAEVILASGAIMTPQLLANSGIGPDGDVVHLAGVGQNLQDHPVVALAFNISAEIALDASSVYTVADEMEDYFLSVAELEDLSETLSNLTDGVRYQLTGRLGTFATAGFSAGAFLQSPWAVGDSPDLQLTVFPRQIEPHVTRQQTQETVMMMRRRAMLVTVALLRPEARYQVRPSRSHEGLIQGLDGGNRDASKHTRRYKKKNNSAFEAEVDPDSPLAKVLHFRLPSIEVPEDKDDYLTDLDVKRLAWGMERVREIQQTPPLSQHTNDEIFPGRHVKGADLEDFIRKNSLPNSHWAGTTKMGSAEDVMAVVDERVRVHGVDSLRIVDSGIFPHVPNGNTHSTVCVVASHAADLIAQDRRRRQRL